MVQGKITEPDTPTIQVGATRSGLISYQPPSSPQFLHLTPIFTPSCQNVIYPGLIQAPNTLACIIFNYLRIDNTEEITPSFKENDSRGDDLIGVDKLGVRDGFAMTFEHVQRLFGVPQVVVVNTVIYTISQHHVYVSFGQGSSLLWTRTPRPYYSRPIALTQEGRSLVNDVCECVRD